MIIFICSILISNVIINNYESKYNNLYSQIKDVEIEGTIDSNITKNEYNYSFELKVEKINGSMKFRNTRLIIKVKNIEKIEYGDNIKVKGEFSKVQAYKNKNVFNYREYLKKYNIYGIIKATDVKTNNKNNDIFVLRQKMRNGIVDKINNLLNQDQASLLVGILLGDTDNIKDDILEDFRISNISHILAVSGAHLSCIMLGVTFVVNKLVENQKIKKILIILVLLMFAFLVGFSPSIIRATFMVIMILIGKLLYRKSNTYISMAISLLFVLLYNPYYIQDIGCLLSYAATLGILLWVDKLENLSKVKNKFLKYILEILIVSLSVNIMIIPIISYSFNKVSLTFFISNLLVSPLIFLIEIIGFLMVLLPHFLSKFIAIPLSLILDLLILISKICSKIPLSQITISSPSILVIIFYYLIIFFIYRRISGNKIKKEKVLIIFMILTLIINNIYIFCNKELKIYFIDVGQGDGCLITTPYGKSVLIDGGGNEDYDIGKNVLSKYLLGKRIRTLDYIIISHFDYDHCGGAFYIMENFNVKNVIIPIQFEQSDNFKRFCEIVSNHKINVIQVKKGDSILLDKEVYLDVLWPSKNEISENIINNNSLVGKISYKKFSILITGDIEQLTEKEIDKMYNERALNSTIIKIPHHGSSSSTTIELLKKVKPKIALIGVGENNSYGHPSNEVIDRLNLFGVKIFRTDKDGEITIIVDENNKIKTNKFVK